MYKRQLQQRPLQRLALGGLFHKHRLQGVGVKAGVEPVSYTHLAHLAAIAAAREAGAIVSFDPNLRFPLWPDLSLIHIFPLVENSGQDASEVRMLLPYLVKAIAAST